VRDGIHGFPCAGKILQPEKSKHIVKKPIETRGTGGERSQERTGLINPYSRNLFTDDSAIAVKGPLDKHANAKGNR
jgi:hypothetical protein